MKRLFVITLILAMLTAGCVGVRPTVPPIQTKPLATPVINSTSNEVVPSVIPTTETTTGDIRYEFDPGAVKSTTYILPSVVWVGGYSWVNPAGNLLQSIKRVTSIVSPVDGKTYTMNLSDWTYNGYYHPSGADASKYFLIHNGNDYQSDFDILLGNPGMSPMSGFNPLPTSFLSWITVSANIVTIDPESDSVVDVIFNEPTNLTNSQAMFLWIQQSGIDRMNALVKSGVKSSELDLLLYFDSEISVPNDVALSDNPSADTAQLIQKFVSSGYLIQCNAKTDNLEFQLKSKEENQGNVVIEDICRWEVVMSPLQ